MQKPPSNSSQPNSIESLAHTINKAGMAGPAALALHIGRPLAWIGGQMLWALEPFLGGLQGSRGTISVQSIASLLEHEENVDKLIQHLDAPHKREKHGL